MRRLFVPRAQLGEGRVALAPADLHYVRDVLRLAPGAAIEIFDGEGGTHAGRIAPEGDAVLIGPRREALRPAARIHLAFALARGERCDVVVQKATELGVTRLSPFEAARSVVRLAAERGEERARRWSRIAAEAARQSGRADVPAVDRPASLLHVLGGIAPGHRVVVPYEGGGEPLVDVVDRAAPGHVLVVGPEGGFTREEVDACLARGARLATLGPRILRFETAAIAATALVQHLVGDLGGPRGDGPDGPTP
jgi:16S rRNA (uracil1498-N3)-methyltransferase